MSIDSVTVDVEANAGTLLKLLGEPMRWEIVRRLAAEDLCTCHLTSDLDSAQPLISHHLKVLRQAGVVRSERVGAFTYYVLQREVVAQLGDLLGELGRATEAHRRRPCS